MNPSLYKQHRQRFDHWVVNEFEGIETVNNLSFTAAAKQNSEQSKTRDIEDGRKFLPKLCIHKINHPNSIHFLFCWYCLKSVHFKKTIAQISFLSKLWYFHFKSKQKSTTILKEKRFAQLSS